MSVQGNGIRLRPAPSGPPAIDLVAKTKQLALLVIAVTLLAVVVVGLFAAAR